MKSVYQFLDIKPWQFFICLFFVCTIFADAQGYCNVCEKDCYGYEGSCYCERKISSEDKLVWDTRHRYNRVYSENTDITVKCLYFKEIHDVLSSGTCSESICSTMSFHYSKMETIPINFFKNTPHLTAIYFNNSGVQNLQVGAFSALSNLKTLQLDGNEMENLKAGCFHTLTNLKTLDLHNNKLKTIDKEAFLGLSSLNDLDLSKNQLTTLSKEVFEPLENLETLILSRNLLSTTDFNLKKLIKLQNLYLNHNNLSSISQCNFGFNLNSLFLQDNALSHVEFCSHSSLSNLNLANNKLTDLNFLTNLSQIITLNVSNNKIVEMAIDTFQNTEYLHTLDLSENEIHKLKIGIFSRANKIEHLNLSRTELEELDSKVLIPLSNLMVLDINYNNISYVDSEMFQHFDSFQKIFLQGNTFACDVTSSLFLQSKKQKFSLEYEKDYSIENIKGLPCGSVKEKHENSTKNETEKQESKIEILSNLKNLTNQITNLEKYIIKEINRNFNNITQLLKPNLEKKSIENIEKLADSTKEINKNFKNITELIETNLQGFKLEKKANEDTDKLADSINEINNNFKNITELLKTNLEDFVSEKTGLKWELEEQNNLIRSEFHDLEDSLKKTLSSGSNKTIDVYPKYSNIEQEKNVYEKLDNSLVQLKILVILCFLVLLGIYTIVKFVSCCFFTKNNRRSFDVGQELPFISN